MSSPADPLRIAVFAQLGYLTPESTGAGKHIIHMVRGLSSSPGVSVNRTSRSAATR